MYICEISQLLYWGAWRREKIIVQCVRLWSQLMELIQLLVSGALCEDIHQECDIFAVVSVLMTFAQLLEEVPLPRVCVCV